MIYIIFIWQFVNNLPINYSSDVMKNGLKILTLHCSSYQILFKSSFMGCCELSRLTFIIYLKLNLVLVVEGGIDLYDWYTCSSIGVVIGSTGNKLSVWMNTLYLCCMLTGGLEWRVWWLGNVNSTIYTWVSPTQSVARDGCGYGVGEQRCTQ